MACFNDYLRSEQTNVVRMAALTALIRRECPNDNIKILEIGSWAGQSTTTMAEALLLYNKGQGSILCVDAWEPLYKPDREILPHTREALQEMNEVARSELIMPMFLMNIEKYGSMISWKRGKSCDVLPTLQRNFFDLIYVDGSHYYDDVTSDVKLSKEIVKRGGIICGDDLDKQLSTMLISEAKQVMIHRNLDFITISPEQRCHPGVSLAVHEAFGIVGEFYGFWYVIQR